MFFWNSLAFWMIQRMLAIWSLVPLPFLGYANANQYGHSNVIWKFLLHLFIQQIFTEHLLHVRHYSSYLDTSVNKTDKNFCPTWIGKIPWNRKWQPTPVFLPEKFHGQKSLVAYSSCRCKNWPWLSICMHAHVCAHTHTQINLDHMVCNKIDVS